MTLSPEQHAIVGAPADLDGLPDGVELPSIDVVIDYTERTEHPDGRRQQRATRSLDGVEAPSLVGYVAVYAIDGKWFAYRETDGGSSRSIGYSTRDEAEADVRRDILGTYRFWCQKVAWLHAGDTVIDRDRRRGWTTNHGRPVIRAGGIHRVVGAEPVKGDSRVGLGHGGSEFKFRYLANGDTLTSHNVWFQGVIPAEFRELLPDNAESVETDAAIRMRERHEQWVAEQRAQREANAWADLAARGWCGTWPDLAGPLRRAHLRAEEARAHEECDARALAHRWADEAYDAWRGTWSDLAEPMAREWADVLEERAYWDEMHAEYYGGLL